MSRQDIGLGFPVGQGTGLEGGKQLRVVADHRWFFQLCSGLEKPGLSLLRTQILPGRMGTDASGLGSIHVRLSLARFGQFRPQGIGCFLADRCDRVRVIQQRTVGADGGKSGQPLRLPGQAGCMGDKFFRKHIHREAFPDLLADRPPGFDLGQEGIPPGIQLQEQIVARKRLQLEDLQGGRSLGRGWGASRLAGDGFGVQDKAKRIG